MTGDQPVVTVRVEHLFAGSPPIGSVVTVRWSPFLQVLVDRGFYSVQPGEDVARRDVQNRVMSGDGAGQEASW